MPEETDTYLKTRIPKEMLDHLRLTCARRKAEGIKPNTQQDVVLRALNDYFDPEVVDPLTLQSIRNQLAQAVRFLKQASVDFRHFGHLDVGTNICRQVQELGFPIDIEGMKPTAAGTEGS